MRRPNILLASEFWNGAAGRGFAHAFRGLGYDVQETDTNHHFLQSKSFGLRLVGRALQWQAAVQYNAAILAAAERAPTDIFFTLKGSYIAPQTVRRLREQGIYCINFFPDVDFDHPGCNFETMRVYDLIATTKTFHLPYLASQGLANVIHVNHGFSPLTHRPMATAASSDHQPWDISYVGNASRHKFEWLSAVARDFPDKSFAIFGDGWSRFASGTPLAPFVKGYSTMGDNFARIVAQTKINLAIHFGPVGQFGWEDSVSSRSFHIPASGGFMLHIDNPDIRELYEVPEEIDTFATRAELSEKIAHYLASPVERRAIAARGHARCVNDYSLTARAEAIFAHMAANRR